METIKISKESLEAFKNNNGLDLAQINGKDVDTPEDWIDEVFDEYVFKPFDSRQLVGYIGDDIVGVRYTLYEIVYRVLSGSEKTIQTIEERAGFQPDYSESPHLITKFERSGWNLVQRFYWED